VYLYLLQAKSGSDKTRSALEQERVNLKEEVERLSSQSAELSKKKQNLEAQLGDAQMRLKEASGKAAELLSSQTKLQVVLCFCSVYGLFFCMCASELQYIFLQQSEISNLTVQNEELEGRLSMSEKKLREANQQIVELQVCIPTVRCTFPYAVIRACIPGCQFCVCVVLKCSMSVQGSCVLESKFQDTVAEETRLKITATNKHKELQNVVEQLQTSVEEEEEAKQMLQSKMLQLTQQVYYTFMLWCSSHFA